MAVDGQKAGPPLVFTSLRGVCVPDGEHIIDWEFAPSTIYLGLAVTMASLMLVSLGLVMIVRNRQSNGEEAG